RKALPLVTAPQKQQSQAQGLALFRNEAVPYSTFRPMSDKARLLSGVGRQAPVCASFEVYVARPEGADIRR
ncbi:hypothetical protein ACTXQV_33835, partial [Klebsiella pneumoniae]